MANQLKTGDRVFDIVYRVITAIIAALTFPIMIFSSLFYIAYQSAFAGLIAGDTGETYFESSIYNLFKSWDLLSGLRESGSNYTEVFAPIKTPFMFIVGLYALCCVMALAIIITAAVSRKKILIIIFSAVSCLALIGELIAFKALEAPFLSEEISLATLSGKWWGVFLNLIALVEGITVGSGYILLWLVFGGIIIWTGAVMLVNSGEGNKKPAKKEKKEKKPKKDKKVKKAGEA